MLLKLGGRIEESYSEHHMQELLRIVPDLKKIHRYHFFIFKGESLVSSYEESLLDEYLKIKNHPPVINENEIVVMPRVGVSSDLSVKVTQWLTDFQLETIHQVDIGSLFSFEMDRDDPLNIIESHHLVHALMDMTNQQYFMSYERLKYCFEHVRMPKLKNFNPKVHSWLIQRQLINYGYDKLTPNMLEDIKVNINGYENLTNLELSMIVWLIKSRYEDMNKDKFMEGLEESQAKEYFYGVSKKMNIQLISPATKEYIKDSSNGAWLYTRESFSQKFYFSKKNASKHAMCSSIEKLVSNGKGVRPGFISPIVLANNLTITNFERSWEKDSKGSYKDVIRIFKGISEYSTSIGVPVISQSLYIVSAKDLGLNLTCPMMSVGVGGRVLSQNNDERVVKVGDKIILMGSQSVARIPLEHLSGSHLDNKKQYKKILPSTNAELQRRMQCVLNRCSELKDKNPIIDIIKTQGKGLSTALFEYLKKVDLGATVQLDQIPRSHPGIDLSDLWCHENYDRYLIVVDGNLHQNFINMADRENCLYQVIGDVTEEKFIRADHSTSQKLLVDLPIHNDIQMVESLQKENRTPSPQVSHHHIDAPEDLKEHIKSVLQHSIVGDKSFIYNQLDSSTTGLVAQDIYIGSSQIPLSDYAVVMNHFEGPSGIAVANGQSILLSVKNPQLSAFKAIHESITNLLGVAWSKPSCRIELSMAAFGDHLLSDEVDQLVKGIENECQQLGVSLKILDSSLFSHQNHNNINSPFVIAQSNVEVNDVEKRVSPCVSLKGTQSLFWINLSENSGLAGSVYATTQGVDDGVIPELAKSDKMKSLIHCMFELHQQSIVTSYHDVSSGGVLTTLIEMFLTSTGNSSMDCMTINWSRQWSELFSEGTGCVIQVSDEPGFLEMVQKHGLTGCLTQVAKVIKNEHYMQEQRLKLVISDQSYVWSYRELISQWNMTSYLLHKATVGDLLSQQARINLLKYPKFGLEVQTTHYIQYSRVNVDEFSPRMAVIREQGCNGYYELAEAFHHAGFIVVDVHMRDLEEGRANLEEFSVVAISGGASFDDAIEPGLLWASKLLANPKLKNQFKGLFEREDTLVLAIGNGAQMLMKVHEELVGDSQWPKPILNSSGNLESYTATVRIESTSPWLKDMDSYSLGIPISCKFGSLKFNLTEKIKTIDGISMRFIDDQGSYANQYPDNPTGSDYQAMGVTSKNNRVICMMGHPERAFLRRQLNWCPEEWGEYTPWFQMFCNAYEYVKKLKD